MCIAVYKPKNVKLPKKEVLQRCWDKNPDGAGFAIATGDAVEGAKGFVDFESFYDTVRKYVRKGVPAVLHFRIATHGGKHPSKTHPFPATSDEGLLDAIDWTQKLGYAIVHNGVISGYGKRKDGELSDTQHFIKDILHDRKLLATLFSSQPAVKLLEEATNSSRIGILRYDGEIVLSGYWHKGEGCWWSNTGYRAEKKNKAVWYPARHQRRTKIEREDTITARLFCSTDNPIQIISELEDYGLTPCPKTQEFVPEHQCYNCYYRKHGTCRLYVDNKRVSEYDVRLNLVIDV